MSSPALLRKSFSFASPPESGPLDAALAAIGRTQEELRWPDLHLEPGRFVTLPADAALARTAHHIITTSSIDTYKQWVGIHDDAIRAGTETPDEIDLSEILTPEELMKVGWGTAEAKRAIARATRAYLYADSAHVAHYRTIIERTYGQFSAQLIAVNRLTLETDAKLRVTELPAVILAHEVVFRGGSLDVYSGCRAAFERVVKEEDI